MAVNDHSLLLYFFNAGPVVKAVMLLLFSASIISWTLIFQRGLILKKARGFLDNFETKFWSGIDLQKLYAESNHKEEPSGLESIFRSGFKEFMRTDKNETPAAERFDAIARAMRIAEAREADMLEQHLPTLATIGSTSPYIGLFGTVWGIMTAFQALGSVQQATISMVAPGISEALIATAMGLFAAIPAVIAYNRYANQVERLLSQYTTFQEEFSAILSRLINKERQTEKFS